MNDDIYTFADIDCALTWLCGVRATSRTPDPCCLRSLRMKLRHDGLALKLWADSNCGQVACIALLPRVMTEDEVISGDWLVPEPLETMDPAGTA